MCRKVTEHVPQSALTAHSEDFSQLGTPTEKFESVADMDFDTFQVGQYETDVLHRLFRWCYQLPHLRHSLATAWPLSTSTSLASGAHAA